MSVAYEGQNPGQTYVVDAACLFGPTNTYRLAVVDGQLKLSNNHKNMLWIITFVPLWIAIGRCAIRCNTSSHPPDGLVVMFEKTSSIKGLLVPGVLPLVPRLRHHRRKACASPPGPAQGREHPSDAHRLDKSR